MSNIIKAGTIRNIKGTNITVVVKHIRINDKKYGQLYTCENTATGSMFPVDRENLIPLKAKK